MTLQSPYDATTTRSKLARFAFSLVAGNAKELISIIKMSNDESEIWPPRPESEDSEGSRQLAPAKLMLIWIAPGGCIVSYAILMLAPFIQEPLFSIGSNRAVDGTDLGTVLICISLGMCIPTYKSKISKVTLIACVLGLIGAFLYG